MRFNTLYLDTAGLSHNFYRACEAMMDAVSDKQQEYFKKEIDELGHGSDTMKSEAKAQVKEVVKEVTFEHMQYDIGIDESALRAMSEQVLIRTVVVLHGNMHTHDPIKTRPGEMTWNKHVNKRGKSPATGEPKDLPFFEQKGDRAGQISENAIKEIKVIFEDGMQKMGEYLDGMISKFVGVL